MDQGGQDPEFTMFVATVIVTVLLAALLGYAAIRKLSHREAVVREYADLGVPENRLNSLAGVLLAGAAGLVLGLAWAPLAVAARAAPRVELIDRPPSRGPFAGRRCESKVYGR
ncbi:DoxX family protein [Rhodococcus oryzae]|uniref:DoxX family protein n=1 Tax=Rhodococcus oryzae TaxID=2571143 RepID=UPI0037122A5A